MRRFPAAILLLASSFAVAGTGKITGRVTDQSGLPVAGMTVEAFPLDMAIQGGVPQALSDDQGHFSLVVVTGTDERGQPYGKKWAVYPHQEKSGYYPDLSSSFFETELNRPQTIKFSDGNVVANIDLKLGPKAGALSGWITDAVTGKPVKYTFELSWTTDPHKAMGGTMSSHYRFLLPPNTDIKLTVTSRGYEPWSYPGSINLEPGQDMPLDIKLEPHKSDGR
jgi:hypothetical protein